MQAFLASDVIHESRVVPLIKAALDDAEVGGQQIQQSRFMQTLAWLEPGVVAERLNANANTDRPADDEEVRPGLHGNGLTSTTVGEVTLQPTAPGVVNRIPSEEGMTFLVAFQNQGDNDEFDVDVVLRIRPDSGKAITVRRTI